MPTAPRIAPDAMASTSGWGVPPSAPMIDSTEKPAIIGTGSLGMFTRAVTRLGNASMPWRTISLPMARPCAGSKLMCVAPGIFALSAVVITRVWKHFATSTTDGMMHW